MTHLLEIDALSYSVGVHDILVDLSFHIDQGETCAIIGRSGSGKSSLLNCLTLFNTPTKGTLKLDGEVYCNSGEVTCHYSQLRRNIIMVAQDYVLIPSLTGLGNITLALEKIKGMSRKEAREFAYDLAASFKLDASLLERYPATFSGGQAQRIALIRAIALSPKVLCLDEVTSALDPETIAGVLSSLREVRKHSEYNDMAIIIVTHMMRFAEVFSDHTYFLESGRIHESGTSNDFFSNPLTDEADRFLKSLELPY